MAKRSATGGEKQRAARAPATSFGRTVTPSTDVVTLLTGHFRSGPGYFAYRPAGTADFLLILTLGGLGRVVSADGQERLVQRGESILIAPGTHQDYGVESSKQYWDLMWAHFRPRNEWLDLLDWPSDAPGVMRLVAGAEPPLRHLRTQFDVVHGAALGGGPLSERLAMNALERLLLIYASINPSRGGPMRDEVVRAVAGFVAANLHRRLTLDVLAEVAGLSVSRLAHRFRAVVGVSAMAYVEQRRLTRARDLLLMTSLSVKQVAAAVGFESPFYFSLRFKRFSGASPTQFRAQPRATGRRIERVGSALAQTRAN